MDLADNILDKALELAESGSWESVRLGDIADELEIGLDEVSRYYRQKDDLAEAMFNRVDQVMMTEASKPGFKKLNGRERIHRVIMVWLLALAPHRRATIDMLKYKLEFGHIHLQASGILRISRTVQWILEAAGSKTVHLARIAEEVGTTGIYLSTFSYWLTDHSEDYTKTVKVLDSLLRKAERLAHVVNPSSLITQPGSQRES